MPAHRPRQLIGGQRLGAAELARQALLVGVACPDQDHRRHWAAPDRRQVAERSRHQQAERPCTDHRHDVTFGDRCAEHGVHRAGHRFDGHGVHVAQALGHRVELAGVGDEPRRRPAATRVGAEPCLQAGPDVAEGEIPAVPDVPGPAGGAGRLDPACCASEHRLQHDPAPRGQHCAVRADGVLGDRADDLVARHEGERHDVLEVARTAAVQGGEVGTADARQHGIDVHPPLGWHGRCVALDQPQRPHPCAASRAQGGHHPRRGKARQRPLEQQGAHRPITAFGDLTSKGPSGSGR